MGTLETYNIKRGDDFYIVLTFEEPQTPPDPALPFDLTVYDNIVCDFREGAAQYTPKVVTRSLENGIIIEGEGSNILLIQMPAEESVKFTEGTFYYDIRFRTGTSVETLLEGKVAVNYNITEI